MKLNLGCGGEKKEGFIGVDIADCGQEIVWDLRGEWAFAYSDTVDEVYASNIFEHLPSMVDTMSELWRILKLGGTAEIIVPSTDGRGAWQDPTHVSYWNGNTWRYFCSNVDPGLTAYMRDRGFIGDFELVDRRVVEVPEKMIFEHVILRKVEV